MRVAAAEEEEEGEEGEAVGDEEEAEGEGGAPPGVGFKLTPESAQADVDGALAVYCCTEGGAMGGAFKRIMVWTGMDCVLMGAPWGCVATDVDDRGPVVEGVFKRGRLWSLTRLGQKCLARTLVVIQGKPDILTARKGEDPSQSSISESLQPRNSAGQKLRALFAMGAIPIGKLVDLSHLSESQVKSLWDAWIALANGRQGDMQSAEVIMRAGAAHLKALGFTVRGGPSITLVEKRTVGLACKQSQLVRKTRQSQ